MGSPTRRARGEDEKAARGLALQRAAAALFDARAYHEVTIAEIARRAGMAKGTFYLYYASKEALFLALLTGHLQDYAAALGHAMADDPDVAALCARFARETAARPAMRRLLALVHGVIEQHAGADEVLAFKQQLLVLLAPVGARLTELTPGAEPADALRLVQQLTALVVGVHQISTPAPAMVEAMARDPSLQVYALSFEAELAAMTQAILQAFARRG